MATQSQNHYFVPNPTAYPFVVSSGLLLLASGFVFSVNNYAPGKWMMILGLLMILSMVFLWFGKVIAESEGGMYHRWEDKSFRWGMIVFICSEVAFFAAFFGALFYFTWFVFVVRTPPRGFSSPSPGRLRAGSRASTRTCGSRTAARQPARST